MAKSAVSATPVTRVQIRGGGRPRLWTDSAYSFFMLRSFSSSPTTTPRTWCATPGVGREAKPGCCGSHSIATRSMSGPKARVASRVRAMAKLVDSRRGAGVCVAERNVERARKRAGCARAHSDGRLPKGDTGVLINRQVGSIMGGVRRSPQPGSEPGDGCPPRYPTCLELLWTGGTKHFRVSFRMAV